MDKEYINRHLVMKSMKIMMNDLINFRAIDFIIADKIFNPNYNRFISIIDWEILDY